MLTAWAVAEIPGLEIDGYRETSTDECDRVMCRTHDDRIISIASPLTAEFAALQDSEHRVGQLLSAGVRERLPFSVPHTLAAGTIGKRRVVVTEDARGTALSAIKDARGALPSLAGALAAIHNLPTSIVTRNVVPQSNSLDCLRDAAGIIDRAHQTGKVPAQLLDRWDAVVEDQGMWQFAPVIVHGDISFDVVLVDELGVSGITGWASARVGDPAEDLREVLSRVAPVIGDEFMAAYLQHRPNHDPRIIHRARFLAELEFAKWLVHGVELRDEATIADGENLLADLLARINADPSLDLGAPKKAPSTIMYPEGIPPLPVAVSRATVSDAGTEATTAPARPFAVLDEPEFEKPSTEPL
jgi:aminoglycoside phosphotransferase